MQIKRELQIAAPFSGVFKSKTKPGLLVRQSLGAGYLLPEQ